MDTPTEPDEITQDLPAEGAQSEGAGRVPPPLENENSIIKTELGTLNFNENTPSTRARSSLRQRYEAEARVIERRIGGLEKARESLGLSQRKMAQLLLVDPSAWTRWTQDPKGAPPHVWRALAWYLALQEKYPALDAAFWLQGVARAADGDRISENADEIRAARLHTRALEIKIQDLSREIARLQQVVPAGESALLGAEGGAAIEAKEQAETRAIANFFLALTFAVLGFILAKFLL